MIKNLIKIAQQASITIRELSKDKLIIHEKADHSPYTNIDLASEAIILAELKKLTPNIPIISEEQPLQDFKERQTWKQHWIVDPLDGTRNLIKGNGEISINIALIENHTPILGLIYSPTDEMCYFAEHGNGAFKQLNNETPISIKTRPFTNKGNVIALSRESQWTHFQRKMGDMPEASQDFIGSAIKFGRIAEGAADLYPCLGKTGEWDTAPGQLIIEEAGGKVVALNGDILRYNRTASIQNPPFMAVGDERLLNEFNLGE